MTPPVSFKTRMRYRKDSQCRSCQYDMGNGCEVLLHSWARKPVDPDHYEYVEGPLWTLVDEWQKQWDWQGGYPSSVATGCPGWHLHDDLRPQKPKDVFREEEKKVSKEYHEMCLVRIVESDQSPRYMAVSESTLRSMLLTEKALSLGVKEHHLRTKIHNMGKITVEAV